MNKKVDPTELFRYLEDKGIRQTWLAEQLSISTQYLTEIKSGRKPVPVWMPERTEAALGLPAYLLFKNLPEPEPAHA